jgi:desulfoferrodoxin (superoxide reductase-like protein)
MKRKFTITGIITLFVFLVVTGSSFANKTSVTITAPEKAKKGTEITIKINVNHSTNTSGHHTDWVWVKVNGKEYQKWEYTKNNLPESNDFILEIKIKAEEKMEITAEGHCNRHGSTGEQKVTVIIE